MGDSKIEWTDATWNPVVGCTWASPGCDHCYAATMTRRLEAMGKKDYAGLTTKKHFNGVVRTLGHRLDGPLHWEKPRRVFVNSMSDLFHKDVPFEFVDKVFAVMALTPQHTYQVLTKRPERMAEYLDRLWKSYGRQAAAMAGFGAPLKDGKCLPFPLDNVWLGTSVEDQQRADERREPLERIAAAGWTTFVSYEPALGPVDWKCWEFLRWLISGGESGPKARPSHPDWHRAARDYCQFEGIAYFFKQWGEWAPAGDSFPGFAVMSGNGQRSALLQPDGQAGTSGDCATPIVRLGKRAAGRLLDGRTWNEFPSALQACQ